MTSPEPGSWLFFRVSKYAARFSREIHVLVNDQIMMNHQHQPIFLCVLFVIFSDFSGCPITEIQHSGHRFHGKPFSEVHSISGGNWKEILAKEDDIILEINGIKGDDNAMVWGAQPEPPRKAFLETRNSLGKDYWHSVLLLNTRVSMELCNYS